MATFSTDVFCIGHDWKYGPSGFGGNAVKSCYGWLIKFLTTKDKLMMEDFSSEKIQDKLSGLNNVPMELSMTYMTPITSDTSELWAGMISFKYVEPDMKFYQVRSCGQ